MPALGLTDHGTMYGCIEFYQKCKDAGIKPIIGCEMYLAPRDLHLKHFNIDNKPFHLVLFAKNNIGYKNLLYLTTVAHLDGFYYKPRIDKKILKQHSEGLIATSACMAGEIPRALKNKSFDDAVKITKEYQDIFSKENFYLELEYLGNNKEQIETNEKIIKLAKKIKAPLTASRDTHYINPEDKIAQDVLVCINTGKVLTDKNRLTMTNFDLNFLHPKLMEEYFKNIAPEVVKNTEKIAGECNVNLDLGEWYFPKFELPNNITPEQELKTISRQGLKNKFPNADEKIKKRLEYELDVICKKGYASYFLIVADLINFARKNKIPTTTRGSAAGSLVGHTIDIIPINPLYFELPFERFLNPYRVSAPDIDMDFADNQRDEILKYAREKYGHKKVANICTFGTMAAKGSVRDVTRVLNLPYSLGDKISKMIPLGIQGVPMTINKALLEVKELKQIYNTDSNAKKIIDLAKKVEGCARHISVHAAGVVISPTILTDFTPLQKAPAGQKEIITQYEMHSCEAVGLIKFDFLGIRNLSILGDAVKLIKKTKNIEIDLDNLLLDDLKTFKFISQGNTFGMFQLGGSGMTKWLTELKPTKIKELAAMIALFRPGPMDSIPEYIAHKQGKKPIKYLDPKFESILKDTYGVITYQDDVMLIAIEFAGYTWETVDKFRKAMGKKIPELMAQQEKDLVEGCQKHSGWSKEKAETLWKLFDPFKGYGFGRAHAASYSMIAYQTAYLKTHFTAEFMTAVMTAEAQNTDKLVEAVQDCKKLKIKVLPPDVNYSRPDFTYISENEIRFGLLAIKNLGSDIANVIISERKANGSFKTLAEFLTRVESKNLNKKSLDALIKSGAMDFFNERNQMLENMDQMINFIRYKNKQKKTNQASLFSVLSKDNSEPVPELNLAPANPIDSKTKLAWEKELLGLYVSGHPFAEMQKNVNPYITCSCAEVNQLNDNDDNFKIAGIITKIHKILTKKNQLMIFATISDLSADVEVLVFPKILERTPEIWQEDKHIFVVGKKSDRDEKAKIIVDLVYEINKKNIQKIISQVEQDTGKIKKRFNNYQNQKLETKNHSDLVGRQELNNINYFNNQSLKNNNQLKNNNLNTKSNLIKNNLNQNISSIYIQLPKYFNSEIHLQLKNIFEQFIGETKVFLTIQQSGTLRKIQTDFTIQYDEMFKIKIEEIVGEGGVKTCQD